MVLGFHFHWSLGLGSSYLKSLLASFGCTVHNIVVFLGKGIIDELIERGTLAIAFISLGPRPFLKLAIFFASVSTNSCTYLDK